MMPHSADQIEKYTIVTRLSVSIYKMNDDDLLRLLISFLQGNKKSLNTFCEKISVSSAVQNSKLRRHMIIAQLFIIIKEFDKDTLLDHLRAFGHPEFRWIRQYPRLCCYMQVDFAIGNRAYRGTIRDISAGGVFIETVEPFIKGQQIALCFTLETKENIPFKIQGNVTRVYPDGIGVMYKKISSYQRDILHAVIRRN